MKRSVLVSLCLIVVASAWMSLASAAEPKAISPTGGPSVTVTAMAADACGVECIGVKVTWSTATAKGIIISGYKVEVTPPAGCTTCASPVNPVNAPASATSAIVPIAVSGTLPPGTYTAKVTATFTATVSGSKTQDLSN